MKLINYAAICAAFIAAPICALAIPLAPNSVIFPGGATFTPANSGLVIQDELLTFRMDATPATPLTDMGGTVQNRVVQNNLDELVFMPRIRDTFNIDGGTFGITAFRLEGFGTYDLDVDYRTDGLGDKGFTSVSRSLDGNIMTYRYDSPLLIDAIAPGLQEESLFPAIVSNATHFENTGKMTIFGQLHTKNIGAPPTAIGNLISVEIAGLAVPAPAPVPLPASFLLLGSVMAGLFGFKRMHQNA